MIKRKRNHNRQQLGFEKLEVRRLLAGVSFDQAARRLTVFGDGADDVLSVGANYALLWVDVNDDARKVFSTNGIDTLFIYGQGGHDTINTEYLTIASLDVTINGHSGNDEIYGGPLVEKIYGANGNDRIEGGGGNDIIFGHAGDDLLFGEEGNDVVHGGPGTDEVQGNSGADLVTGGDGDDSLYGQAGGDTMHGGDGIDFVYGNSGNDTITGGTGNDQLVGGDGNDNLYAGDGNDLVWGESGADYLGGSDGFDQLFGGDGNDSIVAGDGEDRIFGGSGDDTVSAGEGDDTIDGGLGADTIYGGNGDDTIQGDRDVANGQFVYDDPDSVVGGDDLLFGGGGNDTLVGNGGDDLLNGSSGNDILLGHFGNDTLVGQNGEDRLEGGFGADTLLGGNGNDFLFGSIDGDADYIRGDADGDVVLSRIEDTIIGVDINEADAEVLLRDNDLQFSEAEVRRVRLFIEDDPAFLANGSLNNSVVRTPFVNAKLVLENSSQTYSSNTAVEVSDGEFEFVIGLSDEVMSTNFFIGTFDALIHEMSYNWSRISSGEFADLFDDFKAISGWTDVDPNDPANYTKATGSEQWYLNGSYFFSTVENGVSRSANGSAEEDFAATWVSLRTFGTSSNNSGVSGVKKAAVIAFEDAIRDNGVVTELYAG